MMGSLVKGLAVALALTVVSTPAAGVRLKNLVTVENSRQEALVGYGLVVGLDGTGDRSTGSRGTVFTAQTISNMLERFGITVSKDRLRMRNVAAVMVTAKTPPFGREGSRFDVTVSSLGDATSLQGGILLMTPLVNGDGVRYGYSQGPLSIGGYNIDTEAGEKLRKNHALVGRVPNGGVLEITPRRQDFDPDQALRLLLNQPDFVTACRIAEQINAALVSDTSRDGRPSRIARPVSAAVIEVTLPGELKTPDEVVTFLAGIDTLSVEPDLEARVVINERTGTIVTGGNVSISEVMVSHGNLTVHVQQFPVISQPAPFSSSGRTVVVPVTQTQVEEPAAGVKVMPASATVGDLAKALNELGLKPRDLIAVFQAIKQAGALNAKLIIM